MQTVDDLSEGHASESFQYAEIDEERFIELVVECMQKPNWAAEEMNESFCLFDVDGNGYVDPKEIRKTFTKLGENLADSEAEDQLREFDIDGDCQVFLYSSTLRTVLTIYYILRWLLQNTIK